MKIRVQANKKVTKGQVVLKDSEGAPITMDKDGEQVPVVVPISVASGGSDKVSAELDLNDLTIAGFECIARG